MSRKILISTLTTALFFLFFGDNSHILAQRLPRPPDFGANLGGTTQPSSSVKDTLIAHDSLAPRSQSAIESKIDYKAKDSIFFDLKTNKVYLYEKAQMNYQDIELTAGRIEVSFERQEVSAFPKIDSLNREIDRPFFNDKKQEFEARELTYNFQSKKARIKNIVTKQDEMFIHGEVVKKMPNDETFAKHARFTTCDLEHPHFHIVALRAKIIPDDKIVTGGAMLFLNGVPTPLALPFGLFPNTNKRATGVIIPSYGESQPQGFFLREGGFYWAISDYADWKITGDIYSRGEWRTQNSVQYVKRYKYSGGFGFDYGMAPTGERETPNYVQSRTLSVRWSHTQDQKANQNSNFSANVNYFNSASQQFSSDISARLNSQSNSSISYQTSIANLFSVSTTAGLMYNISTRNIDANFPTLNLSLKKPIYPFQRKIKQGNPKWYESFNIKYSMNASNKANAVDSVFWTQDMLKDMTNGMRHNIPMDLNIKLMKGKINWSHSIQYSEQWHFKRTWRGLDTIFAYDEDTGEFLYDSIVKINRDVILDREYGFFTTRDYGYSTSFSTQLFGMLQFKRGPLRAFRHVMSPSIGFSFRPDFFTKASGYHYYEDLNGLETRYNLYQGNPPGFPSGGKSGSINFSLGNNFEMKVRDRKDTITGMRKMKIVDRLNLSTSYNLAADSLNWAPINLSASTTLFGRQTITYSARFDLYARDSNNRPYNKFIWQTGNKFLLFDNQNMSTGFSWSLNSKNSSGRENSQSTLKSANTEIFEKPAAFDMKWSLNINYTIGYSSNYDPRRRPQYTNIWGYPVDDPIFSDYTQTIRQTLSFGGSVNPSEKWSISFNSGFDFLSKKLSQTSFSINRDLHCWKMFFTWSPFGTYREWSFNIKLDSSMLGDALKYDKRKSPLQTDDYF